MTTIHSATPASANGVASAISRVSWGAIFAGAAVAVALLILFTTFGIGIGAAVIDPQYDRNPGSGLGIGSGIYLILTQLIALGAGGFIAARLAGIPRPVTSVLHGAAVWAIATIFLAWAAISGTGAMFGAASSVLGTSASAVGNAGDAIIPDDFSLPDLSQLAGSISLDALPDNLRASLREQGISERNIRQEATEAFRNVFSQQEQDAAMRAARQTLEDILQTPGNAGEDISAFFDTLVGGENAIVSEEERQEAMNVLQRRLGISLEEAEGIVQSVESGVQSSIDEAQGMVEQAQAQAVDTAQAATSAISTTALLLSLASLLALAAACGGAFGGKPDSMVGDRRDDHV